MLTRPERRCSPCKPPASPVSDPAYRRGMDYLLKNQMADGSWYVRTRALGFQPYFETGFPHGVNQSISAAGTSWATMALILVRRRRPARPNPEQTRGSPDPFGRHVLRLLTRAVLKQNHCRTSMPAFWRRDSHAARRREPSTSTGLQSFIGSVRPPPRHLQLMRCRPLTFLGGVVFEPLGL